MTDQGRGPIPGAGPEAETADVQEQWRAAVDDEQDDAPAWDVPTEANEADAVEQFRSAPLDDDDRR